MKYDIEYILSHRVGVRCKNLEEQVQFMHMISSDSTLYTFGGKICCSKGAYKLLDTKINVIGRYNPESITDTSIVHSTTWWEDNGWEVIDFEKEVLIYNIF